ncbi:MAG: NUDIX hydrolase [Phycisphaerales bacterium]
MQPKCERRLIHKGAKFDFEAVSLTLPDGSVVSRDVVRHPGAVTIIPVLDDGRLLLIRNLRVATAGWLYEFPAGTLEPPEPPIDCAARELIEETGHRAATLTPCGTFFTSPGLSDERMFAFIATGLSPVGQDLQDDERIEVHPTPLATVLQMLDANQADDSLRLMDAKSMLALLLALRQNLIPSP